MNPTTQQLEELAVVYPPANNHERTLLHHATLAQDRLLRAYDLENKVLAETGLFDLFTKKPDQFKNLARHIAECERMYRRAIEALERARRTRAKAARAAVAPPEIHDEPVPAEPTTETRPIRTQPAPAHLPLPPKRSGFNPLTPKAGLLHTDI